MNATPFSIPSRDGLTQLCGDIAYSDRGRPPFSLVLIVPGGWFMERDGFMGGSDRSDALIYRGLALALLDRGYAVARYDNRGVRGHELSVIGYEQDADELARSRRYVAQCLDFAVRRTVTPETGCDDLEAVYRFAATRGGIDAERIVLLAHSEGGLHVCRLVGQKRIAPLGLVFFGAGTDSPAGVFRWQCVDRYVETVLGWDADGDRRVTADDVRANYAASLFPIVGVSLDDLLPVGGSWSREDLDLLFARKYEAMRADAVAKPPHAPYPDPCPDFELVAASNAWWRQWFTDSTDALEHLNDCQASVCFHLGEIDSHAPAARSIELLRSRGPTMISPPAFVLHEGRGHSLRTGEPSLGPMDDEAKRALVESIDAILCRGVEAIA